LQRAAPTKTQEGTVEQWQSFKIRPASTNDPREPMARRHADRPLAEAKISVKLNLLVI
jgi:hypothetical protein